MPRCFRLFVIILISFLLLSCGSKKSPTGGPEDTEKPVVLTTLPAQFGQIAEGRIEINFSKPLDASSVTQAIYIYPPVSSKKFTVDKSTLLIKLNEKLAADTNYYVTLSTRLKDLRGNALAENQTLVFANGKFNDLRLAGTVTSEDPTDKPLPVQVSLLSADSLMVINQAIRGETYSIEGLNPASYILRAYIDKDLNGRYDYGREPYFEQNALVQKITNLDISLAYGDSTKPILKLAVAKTNRQIDITFSEPVHSYSSVKVTRLDNQSELPILISKLAGDKLTLLTQPQDAQAYTVELRQLKDNKGNVTDVSRFEIRASFVDDKDAPTVLSSKPRNGTTVSSLEPTIEVHFSEIIPLSGIKATLKTSESTLDIPLDILQGNNDTYIFKPKKTLQNYRSHVLTISATDISGNKMKEDYKLIFLPLLRSE